MPFGDLTGAPHHDGSELYVPDQPKEHGDSFTVLLRVPAISGITRVAVRQVHDGEPFYVQAHIDHADEHETWWRAELTAHNTVSRYRWLTDGGPHGYRWVTAAGTFDHDVTDAHDFRIHLHPTPPAWLADAVLYQIFPDRFARSGRVNEPIPDWAWPASWDDETIYRGRGTPRQFYGGDLYGIAEHLDHISGLGVNTLYLTPVFPAHSNHRYNAATFDHVDPLLGGDAAYRELVDAVHARGMRIIGDLTTNHTGDTHAWFQTAKSDGSSPERSYYFFNEHPDDYVGWFGVPTLPKLDHDSPSLGQRLIDGPDSVVGRWLGFGLDGWRIDVANMTGRFGPQDRNLEVARRIRATMREFGPDRYLVGEHFHDYLADTDGSTWHGVMNYSGFTRPIWTWLVRRDNSFDNWLGAPLQGWPRLPGTGIVETMRSFAAAPWSVLTSSMNIISSHDSPRILTVTGDRRLVAVAAAAMFTMPGVPMIWSGDEIGLEGVTGEDGRRPFPWHRPETWDHDQLGNYARFVAIRRDSDALRGGGLRWAFVDEDRLVYLREHPRETVLVLLSRAAGDPIRLNGPLLGFSRGVAAEVLFGGAEVGWDGDTAVLPGDGPAVHIWRVAAQKDS